MTRMWWPQVEGAANELDADVIHCSLEYFLETKPLLVGDEERAGGAVVNFPDDPFPAEEWFTFFSI